MKKIITVSLVAMMAVTAANAEIASVEYVGNTAALNTTAKENFTDAINELVANKQDTIDDLAAIRSGATAGATALQSAKDYADGLDTAQKTALEQGLATKQDTINNLDEIRSGATLGATSFQSANVAEKEEDVASGNHDKFVPTIARAQKMIDESQTLLNADVSDLTTAVGENTEAIAAINNAETGILKQAQTYADQAEEDAIAAAGTAADGKITTALADYSTTTAMNSAISTAKEEAITSAGAAADGKITTALADYSTTAQMNSAISTAKDQAVAAAKSAGDAAYDTKGAAAQALLDAKADAEKYIDATELEQSQTAQTTALQNYADGKVQDLKGTLTSLATFPAACAEGTSDCALVIRGGKMQWEKVAY